MLYAKSRKSFEVKREKKFITLPRAKIKHRAKHEFAVCFSFAVCFLEHTWKNSCLPCAHELAHGKSQISGSAIYESWMHGKQIQFD